MSDKEDSALDGLSILRLAKTKRAGKEVRILGKLQRLISRRNFAEEINDIREHARSLQ